jgi:hypothetical protein
MKFFQRFFLLLLCTAMGCTQHTDKKKSNAAEQVVKTSASKEGKTVSFAHALEAEGDKVVSIDSGAFLSFLYDGKMAPSKGKIFRKCPSIRDSFKADNFVGDCDMRPDDSVLTAIYAANTVVRKGDRYLYIFTKTQPFRYLACNSLVEMSCFKVSHNTATLKYRQLLSKESLDRDGYYFDWIRLNEKFGGFTVTTYAGGAGGDEGRLRIYYVDTIPAVKILQLNDWSSDNYGTDEYTESKLSLLRGKHHGLYDLKVNTKSVLLTSKKHFRTTYKTTYYSFDGAKYAQVPTE